MYYINPRTDVNNTPDELIEKIKKRVKSSLIQEGGYKEWHKKNALFLINALSNGVELLIEKPKEEVIDKALMDQRILLVDVNNALWFGYGEDPLAFHAVIINGSKGDDYLCLDPFDAQKKVIKKEEMLFAIANRRVIGTLIYAIAVGRNGVIANE